MPASDLEPNNTVVRHVWDVVKRFESVLAALEEAPVRLKSKLPPGALRDELGRFRVWSGKIGAHKAGRGSLDHRLREASHIRNSIIETLQIAAETLGTVRSILSEERVPWEDLQYPETDSDEGISDVEDESSTPQTELRQLVGNLVNITTPLLRLSVSIRNPAPHDRFKGLRNIDCRHFEPNDIEHVRAKFPKAADYVSLRLGRAISRRRQFLRYRENHRKNYGSGLEEVVAAGPLGVSVHDIQSTVASSVPNAYKERFPDTTYEGKEDSEDVLSQTSYALSDNDSTMLRPPTLPESGLNDQPFECPLCFQMISVSGTLSWYRHVYRDLQPCVCTFERCNIPDHSYGSRNEWFEHELQNHRSQCQCPGECSKYFSSSADLQTHIDTEHGDLATDARLSDIMAACQARAPTQCATQCTLCMQPFSSLIALRRHLGKHHEELSLFAVPSHVFGDPRESANGSQDGEGSQSSKDGTNSDIAVIGIEVCPDCDHIFKGSLDQRRLDLHRHQSEQHSPNADDAARGRGRGAIDMERPEVAGEDGLLVPVTESGRPRRSAAPTFGGMEADFDPNAALPTQGHARRQTDADGNSEKVSKRSKASKEKGKKVENQPLAPALTGSLVKLGRKEKEPGVKAEDNFSKRPVSALLTPIHVTLDEDPMNDPALLSLRAGHNELPSLSGSIPVNMMDRHKTQSNARPGPSSYWSVLELQDFEKNVAYFGTDWIEFANHMDTKTPIIIKNQYLRLVVGGKLELEQAAKNADARRERGDDLGPPPTPTPAPKRRYESTQSVLPRNLEPADQKEKR